MGTAMPGVCADDRDGDGPGSLPLTEGPNLAGYSQALAGAPQRAPPRGAQALAGEWPLRCRLGLSQ